MQRRARRKRRVNARDQGQEDLRSSGAHDGFRVLVDRVWPRGVPKDEARIDRWLKNVAPSTELRRWFGHEPERWPEFRRRYRTELNGQPDALALLRDEARRGTVTLLFAARAVERNNAVALAEVLRK